jgi:hypothetical protein
MKNRVIFFVTIICLISRYGIGMDKQQPIAREAIEIITTNMTKKLNTYMCRLSTVNYGQEIIAMQNKLQRYQQQLDQEEQIALGKVRNVLGLDELTWSNYMRVAGQIKALRVQNKHLPLPDAVHDEEFPADFALMIKDKLLEKGIHPYQVSLKYEKNKKHQGLRSSIEMTSFSLTDDILKISKVNPIEFIISPTGYKTMSYKEKNIQSDSVVMSVEGEYVSLMSTFQFIMVLKNYTGSPYTISEVADLRQILWDQIYLRSCLQNKTEAFEAMHNLETSEVFYNSRIENIKMMSKIAYCWQVLELLQRCSSIPQRIQSLELKTVDEQAKTDS